MALSKIDVANMLTGATPIANGGTGLTSNALTPRSKPIIYNGNQSVAQRGTSSTGISSGGYYTIDRWQFSMGNTAGRLTSEQIADGPAGTGLVNCTKLTCTTADTSIASNEVLQFQQAFEGQDLQEFCKGTSDAKKFTVAFYVKGNASATYTCELHDRDNTRYNGQEFAVTTSWNRIVLVFNADTTGAFDDDNANSLSLNFESFETLKYKSIWFINESDFEEFYSSNLVVERLLISKQFPNTLEIEISTHEKILHFTDFRSTLPKVKTLYKNLLISEKIESELLPSLQITNGPIPDGFYSDLISLILTGSPTCITPIIAIMT